MERDTIIADFDESRVKRDKDGKFAEKNAGKIQELEKSTTYLIDSNKLK